MEHFYRKNGPDASVDHVSKERYHELIRARDIFLFSFSKLLPNLLIQIIFYRILSVAKKWHWCRKCYIITFKTCVVSDYLMEKMRLFYSHLFAFIQTFISTSFSVISWVSYIFPFTASPRRFVQKRFERFSHGFFTCTYLYLCIAIKCVMGN